MRINLRKAPILFRGDSLPNAVTNHNDPRVRGKTWAEYYITEGLVAKFASSGSEDIWRRDLRYLVACHVGYKRGTDPKKVNFETYVYNKSPFISFSSRMKTAFAFMDRTQKSKFENCDIGDATHFVWSLEGIEWNRVGIGRFEFTYTASNESVEQFLAEDAEALQKMAADPDTLDLGAFGPILGRLIVAQHTAADNSIHRAELIHVVPFLLANFWHVGDIFLLLRALLRSYRSSEWLLWPKDPFGKSYSAKFPVNKHLKLDHWARRLRGR